MDYTAEDEVIIKEKWDDLLLSCTKICKNDEDWNFIKRAFFLAKEAHQGVRRRSGEPYLLHPIAVAKIVIEEIGLGVKSVVAALLHDVVEDTEYSVEDMERIFGPKIASMVDGLTKMSGVFNADTSEQAEYFRKVLLTLSDDVRVILIKIADRLHNMRTLGAMPMNKQIKITGETIYLFAPLAYRLGLYSIKSELEDLCMKYRFPQQYAEITQKLNETEASRREFIDKFNAPIIAALNRDNINYEISGRVKSIYSIWSKMQRKQIPFEEIYDLFAIRIVFKPLPFPSEKTQCWQVYSTITDIYTPQTGPPAGLDFDAQGQRLRGAAFDRDGSRRGMGRSADTHPADGGYRRKGIRRPLEIQTRHDFAGRRRVRQMAEADPRGAEQPDGKRS